MQYEGLHISLQEMIDEQLLIHASGDANVPFLDGYFFYCMPSKEVQQGTMYMYV